MKASNFNSKLSVSKSVVSKFNNVKNSAMTGSISSYNMTGSISSYWYVTNYYWYSQRQNGFPPFLVFLPTICAKVKCQFSTVR